MAAKRANSSGSITTRKRDGALIVRVSDDSLPSGRRSSIVTRARRDDGRTETSAQHRRRAEQRLAEMQTKVARPSALREGDTTTLRSYAERYLETLEDHKPATVDSYRRHLELWVLPTLGDVSLAAITVDDIDDLDRALRAAGKSVGSRRHARGVLSRVLQQAEAKGRIAHNPVRLATKIRAHKRDRTKGVLSGAEVGAFLGAARGTRWELPVALLGLLGLRRSEVLAVSWDDVDLEAGTLTVRRGLVALSGGRVSLGAPKTDGSVRTLELGLALVALARARRVAQNEHRLHAGALWAPDMIDEAGDPVALVFTDEAGRALPPHRLSDAVERIAVAAGIERRVWPHLLRHSVASVMLAEGHDLGAVASVLGHASAAVTSAVYTHALATNRVRATGAMSAAVGGQWSSITAPR